MDVGLSLYKHDVIASQVRGRGGGGARVVVSSLGLCLQRPPVAGWPLSEVGGTTVSLYSIIYYTGTV